MRRSRIKVMASVPARRKPVKDTREEKDERPDGPVTDETSAAESQDAIVHRAEVEEGEEEKSKMNPTESVDAQTTAFVSKELEKDVCGVSDVASAKESVVTAVGERIAENGEPSTIEASGEESGDVTASQRSGEMEKAEGTTGRTVVTTNDSREAPEPKGSGTSENAPMAKQLSQTRGSFMRPCPRLDGGGSRIRRNSVHGSGASASESEDDCHHRRGPIGNASNAPANRVRNDSVGTTQSPNKAETTTTTTATTTTTTKTSHRRAVENLANATTASDATSAKIFNTSKPRQKRKINVSESARKLAEARREFFHKYENKQPDRTKLTMYDLIYYNPVTNPIKKTERESTNATRSNPPPPTRLDDEEAEDDEDDVGEAMPVPQVKVGPDGHLILDERSLVIEHTGAQKNRQSLARTEALVDDDTNGNGFYKKRQQTRDWPKWETLKFYKALNTVGTDFLLMQSLFPERTRREIKLKFKKEERLNRRFVEKALVYHQEFNIESLQQDLASFEAAEAKESETAQGEKTTGRRGNGPKRINDKSRRLTAASIDEAILRSDETRVERAEKTTTSPSTTSPTTTPPTTTSPTTLSTATVEKKRPPKRRATSSSSSSSTSSPTSTGIVAEATNEYESDPEVYVIKPTRSGRCPKVRKLQAPAINTLDNLFSDADQAGSDEYTDDDDDVDDDQEDDDEGQEDDDEDQEDDDEDQEDATRRQRRASEISRFHVTTSVSEIGQAVPGSLVIVSRESADHPGETLLQVYMVSSDVDGQTGSANRTSMKPVKLTQELLDTVTAGISNVDPISVDDE